MDHFMCWKVEIRLNRSSAHNYIFLKISQLLTCSHFIKTYSFIIIQLCAWWQHKAFRWPQSPDTSISCPSLNFQAQAIKPIKAVHCSPLNIRIQCMCMAAFLFAASLSVFCTTLSFVSEDSLDSTLVQLVWKWQSRWAQLFRLNLLPLSKDIHQCLCSVSFNWSLVCWTKSVCFCHFDIFLKLGVLINACRVKGGKYEGVNIWLTAGTSSFLTSSTALLSFISARFWESSTVMSTWRSSFKCSQLGFPRFCSSCTN